MDCLFPLLKKDIQEERGRSLLRENSPQYIYKYRPINDYSLTNISENTIWLSSLNNVDDKENECTFNYDKSQFSQQVRDSLDCTVLKLKSKLGLCSFTILENSKCMWNAEYGDRGQGVCIKYNIEKVIQEISEWFYPVNYTAKLNDFTSFFKHMANILEKNKNKGRESFKHAFSNEYNIDYLRRAPLTKSTQWQWQKEWRFITPIAAHLQTDLREKQGVTINFIKPDAVLLGPESSKNPRLEKLIKVCEQKEILVIQN